VSKKRGNKPAPKSVRPTTRNTVSNYQRAIAEKAKNVPFIDRVANWIGRRSRLTRTIICALISLVLTISLTILIYGTFFSLDPRRLNFGPINVNNLPFFTFLILAVMGYAFYWAGWRVMIGFDMEDTPLKPGRPAAIWLLMGVAMFILMSAASIVVAIQAAQQ
jgi:hypothetical protein